MKKYTIYGHPDSGYIAVKQGFSWPGALFGIIWLMAKGLWLYVIGLFVVYAVFSQLLSTNAKAISLIPVLMRIYIGISGNGWYESRLKRAGHWTKGQIQARNRRHALEVFRKNNYTATDTSKIIYEKGYSKKKYV